MLSPFTWASSTNPFENSNVTSPSLNSTILTESRSLTIQSGSAALTCSAVWLGRLLARQSFPSSGKQTRQGGPSYLVTSPKTLHPAALPALMPAGESSSTSTFVFWLSLSRPIRSRPMI